MACGIKSASFSCTMMLVAAVLCGYQQQLVFGQLSPYFYDDSCPSLVYVVRRVVGQAIASEPRMAASLLRLHFHDCFVNGCDASVLLDDTSSFTGEKTANPNKDSLRGFEVIDNVKTEVEKVCQGVVSCADILALVAREAVHLVQGPFWQVYYGRRDSTTASLSAANNDIPAPTSSAGTLISKFQAKGLSTQEMVVLSGAHTIGQARCTTFKDRLYSFGGSGQPDSTLDKSYLASLQQQCPNSASSDNNVSPLDVQSPVKFDNAYFNNLKNSKGLLNSDQVLQSTAGDTQNAVGSYSSDAYKFFSDFGPAMIKMGNISPLTGSNGQIRQSCRAVNQ